MQSAEKKNPEETIDLFKFKDLVQPEALRTAIESWNPEWLAKQYKRLAPTWNEAFSFGYDGAVVEALIEQLQKLDSVRYSLFVGEWWEKLGNDEKYTRGRQAMESWTKWGLHHSAVIADIRGSDKDIPRTADQKIRHWLQILRAYSDEYKVANGQTFRGYNMEMRDMIVPKLADKITTNAFQARISEEKRETLFMDFAIAVLNPPEPVVDFSAGW